MNINFLSNKYLRIDRLLTIGMGKKLGKLTRNYADLRIPILMYHSISNDLEKVRHPYFKTITSPQVFAEHMKYLHENNYAVISLAEAVDIITRNPQPATCNSQPVTRNPEPETRNSQLETRNPQLVTRNLEPATRNPQPETRNSQLVPPTPVVLTFDDGFADFYTEAFPILQKYGFCATVFLPTGFISDGECCFKDKRCLTWCEILELAKSRVEFGSHTSTYLQLRDLDWNQVVREIGESRGIIEDKIGEKAESFLYPYAFPAENEGLKERLKNSLVDLGYKNGVTTSIGTAVRGDDPLFLRRIPITRMTIRFFSKPN